MSLRLKQSRADQTKDTNQRGEWHHSTRWAVGPGPAVPWFPTTRFNLISPSQLAIMVAFSISGQKCSSLGRSAATDTPGSLPWTPFADQSQGEATDHSPLCPGRCSTPSLPGRLGGHTQLGPSFLYTSCTRCPAKVSRISSSDSHQSQLLVIDVYPRSSSHHGPKVPHTTA